MSKLRGRGVNGGQLSAALGARDFEAATGFLSAVARVLRRQGQ